MSLQQSVLLPVQPCCARHSFVRRTGSSKIQKFKDSGVRGGDNSRSNAHDYPAQSIKVKVQGVPDGAPCAAMRPSGQNRTGKFTRLPVSPLTDNHLFISKKTEL
jgi:hypothetical protein